MKIITILSLFMGLFVHLNAQTVQPPTPFPAFPGAEGGGMYTTGGRAGYVYSVTSLADTETGNSGTKEGTLRWCLKQSGPRTIVFKVAGIIKLNSSLPIPSNTTIAGQTAPGDGICISDNSTSIEGDNIIVRFIRFRMGDLSGATVQNDAFWGRNHKNIIIDHCSMSWSTDECASFYDNENFTLQWSVLSESLRVSVHDKGNHGFGGIWGGKKASFHHNLLAHHDSRNPRMNGSRYSVRPDLELVDFRNNVIYNWGSNSGYAGEGGSHNFINNYYKPGTSSGNNSRIFSPNADSGENAQQAGVWGKFYVDGNYMFGNTAVTRDNWQGIHPNPSSKSKAELRSDVPFDVPPVSTHTAEEAYEKVLVYGGASFKRDATDVRVMNEVKNRLTPSRASGGGNTKPGLIDSQRDVNGWDTYTYNPADVPVDTDRDGMPDEWEAAKGLDPTKASDGRTKTLSGNNTYTNLEIYLNSLVEEITINQNIGAIPITPPTAMPSVNASNASLNIVYDASGNQLTVSAEDVIESIQVYNIVGQLIATKKCNVATVSLNIPSRERVIIIKAVVAGKGIQTAKVII